MFVTMRLLGLRKGEAWPPWKKNMVYWTSLDKEEVLDLLEEKDDILYLLAKMMIYWTPLGKNKRYLVSLKKDEDIGPSGKTGETWSPCNKGWYSLLPWKNDDILDPLGGKTRDTWSPWWKIPLGDPENIWHRWYKEGSIEPPFEELFDINFKFDHLWPVFLKHIFVFIFYCSSFYFNYFSNQKA